MSNGRRHFRSLGDVSADAAAQEATFNLDPMTEFDRSSLLPIEPPSPLGIVPTIRIQIGGGQQR